MRKFMVTRDLPGVMYCSDSITTELYTVGWI